LGGKYKKRKRKMGKYVRKSKAEIRKTEGKLEFVK
jgi:hypothetical protein